MLRDAASLLEELRAVDESTGIEAKRASRIDRPVLETICAFANEVKEFLKNHLDHIVIHRLRTNQPLAETDLLGLERTLQEIGEEGGDLLLTNLLARKQAPSLAHFVRSLVGMDRAAAQAAFSGFLSDRSLTPPQIRFIEMIIDQLTARGVMEASALYEPPFSDIHAGGPEALFGGRENVIEGIFGQLQVVNAGVKVGAR